MAYTVQQAEEWLAHPRMQAWLRLIREGESHQGAAAYTELYGGGSFADKGFGDHPRIHFDLDGKPGGNWTSAAGAYQIVETTWNRLVEKYGFTSFDPHTQDIAAVLLTAGRGAVQPVLDGDWRTACLNCRDEWASLPSNAHAPGVLSWERAENAWVQWLQPQPQGESNGEVQEASAEAAEEVLSEQAPAPIVESVPAVVNEPKKEKPMSFIAAAIPLLAQYLPSVIRLFGGNTEVTERNAKAAEAVGAVVVKAVGATNVQEAVQKVATDIESREKAEAAIQASWHDLTQLMGGVKAAADIDRQDMEAAATRMTSMSVEALKPFYLVAKAQFVLTAVVMLGAMAAIIISVTKIENGKPLPDLPGWANMLLGTLIVAIALEWRSIIVFVTGTNKDSSAKTALLAQMTPPRK